MEPLKNIKSYKDLSFDRSNRRFSFQELAKSKKMKNEFKSLIEYDGASELQISGSILTIIPGLTGLTIPTLLELLNISKSTFYRTKEQKYLEPITADRLSALLKLYEKGVEAFDGDKDDFDEWLETRIPNLGDERPIDLLKTETGRNAVNEAIARIAHNIYG